MDLAQQGIAHGTRLENKLAINKEATGDQFDDWTQSKVLTVAASRIMSSENRRIVLGLQQQGKTLQHEYYPTLLRQLRVQFNRTRGDFFLKEKSKWFW